MTMNEWRIQHNAAKWYLSDEAEMLRAADLGNSDERVLGMAAFSAISMIVLYILFVAAILAH